MCRWIVLVLLLELVPRPYRYAKRCGRVDSGVSFQFGYACLASSAQVPSFKKPRYRASVLECAGPPALSSVSRPSQSSRGLEHSTTLRALRHQHPSCRFGALMASFTTMNATLTIQFPGELGSFVEQQRWSWLEQELAQAMQADASEFVPLDVRSVIAEAKARKQARPR